MHQDGSKALFQDGSKALFMEDQTVSARSRKEYPRTGPVSPSPRAYDLKVLNPASPGNQRLPFNHVVLAKSLEVRKEAEFSGGEMRVSLTRNTVALNAEVELKNLDGSGSEVQSCHLPAPA